MLPRAAATCSRDQSPRYRGGSGATKSGTIDNDGGSIKGSSLKFIKQNPPAFSSDEVSKYSLYILIRQVKEYVSTEPGCSRDRCVTRMIPSDFLKASLLTIEILRAKIFPVAAIFQRIEKCPQRVEYRGIATHEVLQDDTHPVHGFSP
jgi:hypothetical protein